MSDSTTRFGDRAEDYAKYRPSYPAEIVEAITHGFQAPVIADLGAGTGISAKLLAETGAFVFAIEPNAAMRAAMPAHERIVPVNATAEATALDSRSVDIITAFQAYHWFDVPAVMREAARIAKPRARFAAVWNHRDRTDAMTAAYEAIVDRYDSSGGAIDRDRRAGTVMDDLVKSGWRDVRKVTATHAQELDWNSLVGFVRSASYLPRTGEAYESMAAALRAIYDAHAELGPVRFIWTTEAFIGERLSHATMT